MSIRSAHAGNKIMLPCPWWFHQRHWDEIRRRELLSFEQFRSDIAKLTEAARAFQKDSATLLDEQRLQSRRDARPCVSLSGATAAAAKANRHRDSRRSKVISPAKCHPEIQEPVFRQYAEHLGRKYYDTT